MEISIIGLGWFGQPLARVLIQDGHKVAGTSRTPENLQNLKDLGVSVSQLNYPAKPDAALLSADVIVLNIPPFPEELEWFKSWNLSPDTWMIFISSTSQAPLLLEQEAWVQQNFSQWSILRFAGLLGGGRHPGKSLSGKKNLPGRLWPVNLIHQDDVVEFTRRVIQQKLKQQVINVVSDEHPTREEFYTDYCRRENLPVPEFLPTDDSSKAIVSSELFRQYYSSFTSLKKL